MNAARPLAGYVPVLDEGVLLLLEVGPHAVHLLLERVAPLELEVHAWSLSGLGLLVVGGLSLPVLCRVFKVSVRIRSGPPPH